MKRLLAVLILLAIAVSGCSRATNTQARHRQRVPQRIVSLVPSSTEILFALGLWDKVVGVTSFCNYPPEAAKKPKIGGTSVSIEKVIAAKPDLVVAHTFLNRAQISKLKNLNVQVLDTDPKTINEVMSSIETIGKATGTIDQASKIVRKLKQDIDSVEKQKVEKHPRMLVVIQTSPLWVAGPQTFVDEMIDMVHATNVADAAKPGFNQFSIETAIARNPEVIIVTRKEDRDFIEKSFIWKTTSAVKNGKVVVIDPDLILRPGPRLTQGLFALHNAE